MQNINIELLNHLDLLKTTDLGIIRIQRNLNLEEIDVVEWCKKEIIKYKNSISRKGKNWYITTDISVITVNAYSYTIITAHPIKKPIQK